MNFSPENLTILACPQCSGDLKLTKEEVLFCIPCRLCFPVDNGVANLNLESALSLSADGKILPKKKNAIFSMVAGKKVGFKFRLDPNQCLILGRYFNPETDTQVFNVDFSVSLDENAKQLVKNYLLKMISNGQKNLKSINLDDVHSHQIGPFKRLKDILLDDSDISRVHAMIFFDEVGAGILDLVSRNGTYINGDEVEAMRIKSGDEILIGNTTFKYSNNH